MTLAYGAALKLFVMLPDVPHGIIMEQEMVLLEPWTGGWSRHYLKKGGQLIKAVLCLGKVGDCSICARCIGSVEL